MKKILITGANSYIGTSFENYIKQFAGYQVDTIDMKSGEWRNKSFHGYDSIFHVAGIAHSDSGKISKEKEKLYYSVNTDLAIETAIKAKNDGVKQFIFMSSIIIYGDSAPINKEKIIKRDTIPSPKNCYGDSKLRAENGIIPLSDEKFKVAILRPPMIYGKGCKGNYNSLSKIAKKVSLFPYITNQRSILYIENLCEFVRLIIDNCDSGIFFPQNEEYVNTSEMIQLIGKVNGKKITLVKGFSWAFKLLSIITGLVNKAFGNLTYDKTLSYYKNNYKIVDFINSIEKTEKSHD